MHYAMTIKDNLITGVHESETPITETTFVANPAMAEDKVIVLGGPMEYQIGWDIRAYEEDGTLKPELWRIENGYAKLPIGYEIIEGELVKTNIPEIEAPPLLMERVQNMEQKVILNETIMAELLALLINTGVIINV